MKLTKTHGNYIMLCIIILFLILSLGLVNHLHISVMESEHILKAQSKDADYSNKGLIQEEATPKYPSDSPVYYSILRSWINIFGKSPFMVRLMSILFSVAALYFSYMVSRKFIPVELSLLAVFLLAINPKFISEAATVSPTPFLTLCFAVALHYLLNLRDNLDETLDYTNLIFFLGFSILAVYTSLFGYILFILGAYVMIQKSLKRKTEDNKIDPKIRPKIDRKVGRKKDGKISKYLGIGIIVALLVTIIRILPLFSYISKNGILPISGLGLMTNPFLFLMGLMQGFYPSTVEIMYLTFACVIVALFSLGKMRHGKILLLMLGSTVFMAYLSIFAGATIYSIYLMFMIPVYLLIAVIGIVNIKDRWVQYLLVISLIVTSITSMWGIFTSPAEIGPAEIAALIKSEYRENDIVIISPLAYVNIFDYYADDYTIKRYGANGPQNLTTEDVKSAMGRHNRIWLVFGTDVGQGAIYRLPQAYEFLKTDFVPVPRAEYHDERLFLLTAIP
ncbi:glycosyltransferase family 39 protein [Candidatus Woesearchaeota archaeon]|nr:glycosyltransferase family 39 protein [Candidatus Woesearchaeota archaeon]